MTDIVLTPAELEMIALKRKQFELEQQEKALKQKAQLEKDIADKLAYIQKRMSVDQAQVKAAQDYCKELGAGYTVVITGSTEMVKITGDYTNPVDPSSNGYERVVLWSESFKRETAHITNGSYTVTVAEQLVYSSKWSTRSTSKGYKMYVSGPGIDWKDSNRALSRVAKVKEKIKIASDSIKAEEDLKNRQKNALQATVDKFQAEYPDAEVTTDKGWDKSYGKRYEGVIYDMVRIKFVNGASIAYRVYADGSLGRVSFNLPGAKDEATFRNNLSQMKF
jgi:hypothetical protein